MILEPIYPTILSVRRLYNAHPSILEAYGADPARHTSLALITCDQDDPTYVALDEATKSAPVDVVYARSFYAGAAHASGRLSGEILGVLAGADPDEVEEGMNAAIRCLEHDACFYSANDDATIAVFPHVISSLGFYLSAEAGLQPGDAMAYLVAPPMEATIGFDADDNEVVLVTREGERVTVEVTNYYSTFQEFGTTKMAPNPFVGPAFQRHAPELVAEVERVRNKLVARLS